MTRTSRRRWSSRILWWHSRPSPRTLKLYRPARRYPNRPPLPPPFFFFNNEASLLFVFFFAHRLPRTDRSLGRPHTVRERRRSLRHLLILPTRRPGLSPIFFP